MAKKKTPLLQLLRANSGTVYVFPSASEDVGLNLNNDVYSVTLTHYALLNIPAISFDKLCFGKNEQLYNDTADIEPNKLLAMSLLNYMMNFETVLLNQETYNFQNLETVSERVFWHWMKAIGALSMNFDKEEIFETTVGDTTYFYNENLENRVVQCFGSIDAGNKVHSEFGMFNETYINIPSSYGSGPVFFKLKFDENFKSGTTYQVTTTDALEGRDPLNEISYSDNHDFPYLDKGVNGYLISKPNAENKQTLLDGIEIEKDFDNLTEIINNIIVDDKNLPVLSYDELNVDPQNRLYTNTGKLVYDNFDFNAILLYYSIYDQNDNVSRVHATNLFGIIFLDGADVLTTPNAETGVSEKKLYIPTLNKRKSTTTAFGTGYSFRINVKTLSIYDDTSGIIQDNTTAASTTSDNFNGVIQSLNNAINILNTNTYTISVIQDQYAKILHIYDELQRDITDISTLLYDYVEGRTNPVLSVNTLYTNNICVKSESNNKLGILMPVTDAEGYEEGETPYTEIASFSTDGFSTNTIYGINTFENHYYVIHNSYAGDYPVTTNPNSLNTSNSNTTNSTMALKLTEATNLITSMFEPTVDNDNLTYALNVNLGSLLITENYSSGLGEDTDVTVQYKYDMYIDPKSAIFTSENGIGHLKAQYAPDSITEGLNIYSVDYVGLIPYIIAELQLLNNYSYNSDKIIGIEKTDEIKHLTLHEAINFIIHNISQFKTVNDTTIKDVVNQELTENPKLEDLVNNKISDRADEFITNNTLQIANFEKRLKALEELIKKN